MARQGGTLDRHFDRMPGSTHRLRAGQSFLRLGFKHVAVECISPSGVWASLQSLRGTSRVSTLSFCSGRRGPCSAWKKGSMSPSGCRGEGPVIVQSRFSAACTNPQGDTYAGGIGPRIWDSRQGSRCIGWRGARGGSPSMTRVSMRVGAGGAAPYNLRTIQTGETCLSGAGSFRFANSNQGPAITCRQTYHSNSDSRSQLNPDRLSHVLDPHPRRGR